MKALDSLLISGRELLPIVEGGKGVSISNGLSAGSFAAAGCVGTFSGVNADSFDDQGRVVPQVYRGKTRRERYEELIAYGIQGGIAQARKAHETSNGSGRLHMNVLWEAAATPRILHGVLACRICRSVCCGAAFAKSVQPCCGEFSSFSKKCSLT